MPKVGATPLLLVPRPLPEYPCHIDSIDDESINIQNQLREASRYAREHADRLTHAQVFEGLQEIINAGRWASPVLCGPVLGWHSQCGTGRQATVLYDTRAFMFRLFRRSNL